MFFRVCKHFPEVKWVNSRFSNPQPKSGVMMMVVVVLAADVYVALTVLSTLPKWNHLVFITNLWGRCCGYSHFTDEEVEVRKVPWLARGHTAGKWHHQDSAQTFVPEFILYNTYHVLQQMLPPLTPGLLSCNRSLLWFNGKSYRIILDYNKVTSQDFIREWIRL